MCTLVYLWRVVDGHDIVLAMNRDEDPNRPAEPPAVVATNPRVVAGRDARAGGTWLGTNEHGLVVAVSNRRDGARPDAPSRGLLALELLKTNAPRHAEMALRHALEEAEYNGFNVLLGNREELLFVDHDRDTRKVRGQDGLNVLTNAGANEPSDPKVAVVSSILDPKSLGDIRAAIPALQNAMRHHGDPSICAHGTRTSTVSSTILALHNADPHESVLLYAAGNPCETPYRDHSRLM